MALSLQWIEIGSGRLALSERPKVKEISKLRDLGCDRMVTVLGKRGEDALGLGDEAKRCGLSWDWLVISDSKWNERSDQAAFASGASKIASYLEGGESVLIHCSAGIHRTGILAFLVLKESGFESESALEKIKELRPKTRAGLDVALLKREGLF